MAQTLELLWAMDNPSRKHGNASQSSMTLVSQFCSFFRASSALVLFRLGGAYGPALPFRVVRVGNGQLRCKQKEPLPLLRWATTALPIPWKPP